MNSGIRNTRIAVDRYGMSRLEVVLTATALLFLVILTLPNLVRSRGTSEAHLCQNRIKNISLALISFAESHRGPLPPSQTLSSLRLGGPIGDRHSWVVDVLPHLDQYVVYESWNFEKPWFGDKNITLSQRRIGELICPIDESAVGTPGGLTYVVNCGYDDAIQDDQSKSIMMEHDPSSEAIDWDGDGVRNGILESSYDFDQDDTDIHRDTGVFGPSLSVWRGQSNVSLSHSLARIFDGSGETIMLTENLKAGNSKDDQYCGALTSWANPALGNCGFVYNVHPDSGPLQFAQPRSHPASPSRINANHVWAEGSAPHPSSNHSKAIWAGFCDGTVRVLSDSIDEQVYAQLITPAGRRLRQSVPQLRPQLPLDPEGW